MGRDVLGELLEAGCDRVLTDGYDLAKCLNVGHAGDGRGAFGVVAQTFRSWIEGLWELWGDGRGMVGPLQRQMVLREVLVQEGFDGAPHLPALLGRYLKRVCGLREYEGLLDGAWAVEPTDAERKLLHCLGIYRERLRELGFIEPGEAQLRMAEAIGAGAVPRRAVGSRIAYLSNAPMAPDVREFFKVSGLIEGLDVLDVDGRPYDFEEPAIEAAPDGLDVSFAFPSGAYAQPQLLISLVEEAVRKGPVTIAAKDPHALYESIASGLSARGIRCAVKGSKSFATTSLGGALLALREFLASSPSTVSESQLADAMALPFLGIGRGARWQGDRAIRGDRLIERDRMLSDHFDAEGRPVGARESEEPSEDTVARLLHRLVSEPREADFDALERVIRSYRDVEDLGDLGLSLEDWKAEQLAALACVRELFEVARAAGVPRGEMGDAYVELLRQSSVPVRFANYERSVGVAPDVLVLDQAAATSPSLLRPATLIACDLDGASYPAAQRDDACSRLFYERMGLPSGEDYLSRMRRTWNELVAVPTDGFVALRCLNDVDGDPTYPCAMLEEFVDAYRDLDSDDALTGDDLDETFLLPKELLGSIVTRGEGDLFQDVFAGADAPVVVAVADGDGEAEKAWIAPRDGDGRILLSPTAVDAYRACPYFWFISRRLASGAIDEELDPLSRGNFYHTVFRTFSEEMKRADMSKVTPANLAQAHQMMERAFHSVVDRQREGDLTGRGNVGNRYVARPGTTESSELDFIRSNLHGWVDDQSEFLHAEGAGEAGWHFVPTEFEVSLDEYDVEYATARLRGRIDRIDVDADRVEAIVVDYKGGLDSAYDVNADKGLAGRMLQGLIYGAVVRTTPLLRRRLGLIEEPNDPTVRAIVYKSYNPGYGVRGTYVLDEDQDLPLRATALLKSGKPKAQVKKGDKTSVAALDGLLEEVERTVETEVVEPMDRGEVPRTKGRDCAHCPVAWCPERKSHGAR